MVETQSLEELQWLKQAIESDTLRALSIRFDFASSTSFCFRETESAIVASFSVGEHGNAAFSSLVTDLCKNTAVHSILTRAEFHRVGWKLELVRVVGSLLADCRSIKQLHFHRNRFDVECLSAVGEILKRNSVIKQVFFSESDIGSIGTELIASAIQKNESVEEFQVWEDSIGPKGAQKLSMMIEANSTLKILTIFDLSSSSTTQIISSVLGRNREMEVHIWEMEANKICKSAEFIREDGVLRLYKLDKLGSRTVICSLAYNTTVSLLDLTGIPLTTRWAKLFRLILEQNTRLKKVILSRTRLKNNGVKYVAAALFQNKNVESLSLDGNLFGGKGVSYLLCPLSKFSTLQHQANTTLKSITFGGGKTRIGQDGLSAIIRLLETNESLKKLRIHDDQSLNPDDFVKIFQRLKTNASLRCLSLQGCEGIRGNVVLEAIMETLQVNPWMNKIDLARTPLHNLGLAEEIYQKLNQNERIEPETDADFSKDMPLVEPKSLRVFLCGNELAGKTTLCSTMMKSFSSSNGNLVRILMNPVEQEGARTSGMKMKIIKHGDLKISLWNLSGKHERFALHDLMFPGYGSAPLFLVTSSLFQKPNNQGQKSPQEIEEELQYWLRFIVSNSKRSIQPCMLPNVAIALTHCDKTISCSYNLAPVMNRIQSLGRKFSGFVELYQDIFPIDARSAGSVRKLMIHIEEKMKQILERVPRVYKLYNDLIQILLDWRRENKNQPMMRWKEFEELCQLKVPSLRVQSRYNGSSLVETRRKALATCLHHVAEVIYFDESNILILDPEWFCDHVLGKLLKLDGGKHNCTDNVGFLARVKLEEILRKMASEIFLNLEADDLVKMMLQLELCYERDPSDPNSPLLIPLILEEGRRKPQKWQLSTLNCIYIGRHLECDDSNHASLSHDFFPRLQVLLYHRIIAQNNQHRTTYRLERYLIEMNINGIGIRVELGGKMGHHVDVLACSTKNITSTLALIQELIIPAIHSLCQGVVLVENIMRPGCVQNLTPPRYRRTQHVSLQHLKQALLSVPAECMYDYQHDWDPVSDSGTPILPGGFDFARDLLSDNDFRQVLHRRCNDLHSLAVELDVAPERSTSDGTGYLLDEADKIEPSLAGIAGGVQQLLQRLIIVEQVIRDLRQEIHGLRYYEHRLIIELHRKVDQLVNYNIDVEERKLPNLFYFVRTENYARRLVADFIPGMTALRLHMLCEYRNEMHAVGDQMGCEITLLDNNAVKCLAPYAKKFMKLVTIALRIGAHLAAGLGEMIPDLSQEVGCLTGSSTIHGAEGAAAGALGLGMAAAGKTRGTTSRSLDRRGNIQRDQQPAQQWVADLLKERNCFSGKEIAEKFGLWRVRYHDDGHIAWICRWHVSSKAREIALMPI